MSNSHVRRLNVRITILVFSTTQSTSIIKQFDRDTNCRLINRERTEKKHVYSSGPRLAVEPRNKTLVIEIGVNTGESGLSKIAFLKFFVRDHMFFKFQTLSSSRTRFRMLKLSSRSLNPRSNGEIPCVGPPPNIDIRMHI